jgi:hypothetical protein
MAGSEFPLMEESIHGHHGKLTDNDKVNIGMEHSLISRTPENLAMGYVGGRLIDILTRFPPKAFGTRYPKCFLSLP